MKIQLLHTYNDIIKLENLLLAWEDFVADKKEKVDVELFSRYLMDNIVSLHPNKLFLMTMSSGIDFLGWKHFSDHRVLRKTTEKRMFARVKIHPTKGTFRSYFGLVKHGDGLKLRDRLLNEYWLSAVSK